MATAKKNPASENNGPPALDPKEFADWQEEKLGFSPYWQPVEGASFVAIPTEVDDQGKFVRVVMVATRDTQCFTGPTDSQEPVTVAKGETFTLSIYSGLKKVFTDYLTAGFPVEIMVTALEKIETDNGNDFWRFRVAVEPGAAKQLAATRATRNAEKLNGIRAAALKSKGA